MKDALRGLFAFALLAAPGPAYALGDAPAAPPNAAPSAAASAAPPGSVAPPGSAAPAAPAEPPAVAAPPPASAAPAAPPVVGARAGQSAPAFSVRLLDGKTVGLDAFRGKTLVLNVWGTWCPPCRLEMPDLSAAAPAYAKDGSTAFLGVDTTEAAPIVRAYGAAKNVTYPLAIADDSSSFAKDYDIVAFPTTFVIDPRGVIRARYTDVLARRQIAEIVAAGKAERNVAIVSPLQSKIDALLLDPAIVFTSGDPATIEKQAKAAQAAMAGAEKLLDQSDAASGNSTDFDRTRAEEATLRDKAIAALVQFGTSVRDTSLLPELSGDAARDRERWNEAAEAYRAVLLIEPKNEDALDGLSYASIRLEQYPAAVDADAQLVALEPESVTALVRLALDQAKAGRATDAYASFARAVALAKRHVDTSHGKAAAVRSLAYAHLYAGRTYAKNGDSAAARAQFDEMLAWSEKLPRDDERHDMYLEEGQEAIAALELGTRSGISVSLAPWTGSDLPGSIPNTFKYRLVLAGGAGTSVTLRARGVPKMWVASFCSDKICAPMQVGVAIPESGVKVVEFQLVPPGNERAAPKVLVTGSDGRTETSAST